MNHYLEAIRLKPDFSEAHTPLGIALAIQGEIRRALSHFSEAVRIDPRSLEARGNRIRALWLLGLREPAVDELTILKELDPVRGDEVEAWINSTASANSDRRSLGSSQP